MYEQEHKKKKKKQYNTIQYNTIHFISPHPNEVFGTNLQRLKYAV